jgi:hypothetical protein
MNPGWRDLVLIVLRMAAFFTLFSFPVVWAQEGNKQEGNKAENITLKDGMVKVDGALKADDEKDKAQKHPCKIFTVDLKSGQNYKIDMVSKEIDSFLRLEDAAGKELAKDDDSGGFVNARINFHCPTAGAYRVICTTFGGGTGAFTLTIQEATIAKAAQLPLNDGMAKVEAKLTAMDAADAVQTHSLCKVYAVKLAKGKSYQIDMMSTDVDSFLRLEDSTGKELAKDDDSGDGSNARIQFSCPENGEYRIIATTFFGGMGSFALTVKEK